MYALITSCGRYDLLQLTVSSLLTGSKYRIYPILINEDSGKFEGINSLELKPKGSTAYIGTNYTNKMGQHASVELFLSGYGGRNPDLEQQKYYLHVEDDWEFKNSYNWIQASLDIMEHDPTVIKVLARNGSPHPCTHDHSLNGVKYGYVNPWTNNNIEWYGFSWNPGVTRFDLLKKFIPFPKWEQELAKRIFDAGYKVVELSQPVYNHIGDGRSTHE